MKPKTISKGASLGCTCQQCQGTHRQRAYKWTKMVAAAAANGETLALLERWMQWASHLAGCATETNEECDCGWQELADETTELQRKDKQIELSPKPVNAGPFTDEMIKDLEKSLGAYEVSRNTAISHK